MANNTTIRKYQQRCHREYPGSVDLPVPYTFPDGNPIRPLPPVKTAVGELLIVGAYPSARFEARRSRITPGQYRLIPVADNLQPFGYEEYFDGIKIRTLTSADGLQDYLLSPLGILPDRCWITDLVKVFLYKPAHVDSCGDVVPEFKVPMLRRRFRKLGLQSLPWLAEECTIGNPKLIVTLGQEVAQVVSGKLSGRSDDLLLPEITRSLALGDLPIIHLPHPDACRRHEKWRLRMAESVQAIGAFLEIVKAA